MSKKEKDYTAELWKQLKRQGQRKRGVVTDADMGKINKDGKTPGGKILLLSQVLDEKKISFKDFFQP